MQTKPWTGEGAAQDAPSMPFGAACSRAAFEQPPSSQHPEQAAKVRVRSNYRTLLRTRTLDTLASRRRKTSLRFNAGVPPSNTNTGLMR